MRIGCHIPCYKLTYFLPAVLKSVAWVDRVLVTNSTMPWDDSISQWDDTEYVVNKVNQDNVELLKGNWSKDSEHNQRNMAMKVLSDCNYIFLIDSDEIMLLGEQKGLIEFAEANKSYDGYAVNTIPYYKDLSHVAKYDTGNTPLALVRPSAKFFITRCIENKWVYNEKFNIHHFKFLQPKEQIGWRIKAKHQDQQRKFGEVVEVTKNQELADYMGSCGYTTFTSEVDNIEEA